jgi:hypothetical protein
LRFLSPQIGDVQALFQRETAGTKLHGVTRGELATVALVRPHRSKRSPPRDAIFAHNAA